jgi:hypothetical protein
MQNRFLMYLLLVFAVHSGSTTGGQRASESLAILKGSIVDASGGPIRKASLRLIRLQEGKEAAVVARVESRDDGTFRMEVASSSGQHRLRVDAGGMRAAQVDLSLGPGRTETDVGPIILQVNCSPPASCDDFGLQAPHSR